MGQIVLAIFVKGYLVTINTKLFSILTTSFRVSYKGILGKLATPSGSNVSWAIKFVLAIFCRR